MRGTSAANPFDGRGDQRKSIRPVGHGADRAASRAHAANTPRTCYLCCTTATKRDSRRPFARAMCCSQIAISVRVDLPSRRARTPARSSPSLAPRDSSAPPAESVDVFERKIRILERGGWFADPEAQARRRSTSSLRPPSARVTCRRNYFRDPLHYAHERGRRRVSRGAQLRELQAAPKAARRAPNAPHGPHGPSRSARSASPMILVHPRRCRAIRAGASESSRRTSARAEVGVRAERELIRHAPASPALCGVGGRTRRS